ncbi:MAG TPA: glycine oxidase ThiO [Candidatus Dormibacteraeota bacterium]|nr:glycine oxidase ThiO [Candidatus Dormibacteraeota bacterium]
MRTYDVAIIGGGIIGASIAFELAAEKLRVGVFDRQEPGREASWAAAGMLSPAPDSPRDLPLVPFAKESLKLYPRFVQAIEELSGKSCAYACEGAMELFFSSEAETECRARLRSLNELGIAAELISTDAARRTEGAINAAARAALWLSEEGTVEPRLVMDALLTAARHRGVEIHANRGITEIVRESDRCTGVIAGGEKVSAAHVILAAGCFSGDVSRAESLSQLAATRPVRGQMIALRPANCAALRRVVRSEHGYLVPRRDGRIVAGSTTEEAGFEKHLTAAGLRKIIDGAVELCPAIAEAQIAETWAGLRPGTPDDLPILGPADLSGLWIATGHYRNGILLAPATAMLVSGWVMGRKPEFDVEAFSPTRFSRRETRAQTAV